MGVPLALLCIAAAAYSAVLVDSIRALALARGWIDRPHDRGGGPAYRAIPRVGGAGILGAVVCALIACAAWGVMPIDRGAVLALASVGAAVYVVGLLDDVRGVPAPVKALVLALAGVACLPLGLRLDVLGDASAAGMILGVAATLGWFIAVPSAINFVDGLDGLAAGLTTVAAIVIALLGALHGDGTTTCVAAIIAAATIGFWYHNSHPARVFMGDGGAMLLGFLLAATSLRLLHSAGVTAFLVAMAAMAWPLVDFALAVMRRVRRRALFQSDADHLHHLLARRYGHRRAVVLMHRAAGTVAALALLPSPALRPLALLALALAWSGVLLRAARLSLPPRTAAALAAASLGALLLMVDRTPQAAPAPGPLAARLELQGSPTAAEVGVP